MIFARLTSAGFAARLAAKAGKLAAAEMESRHRARRGDARRWRLARLLWPLFDKERE